MTEINGLNERITDLKMQYQEAERINLKSKAGELLADINYLEELRELRSKQEQRKLEQEHDKPMIEIDLYSVIKQKYIEREVLDKIRAEIMRLDDINPDYPMDRTIHISRNEVLQIIDKYRIESEDK